ncbi:hypothetical protein [Bifidobacterium callitrichidarum]|uniref:Uncharacterized protein n=1 Tax=Bifidobacterium callitrichidarum TaxID=2052941 RepID=A0A2U2N909_9BIFI|nr:hypothetical protein [Bifidobacterium callitrichidarum]PWG65593.1 hypothetical protein DF196_06570 [Bifidobacterium callitrichidarum]
MSEPTEATHDMDGLRKARRITLAYRFTDDDTTRMEARFQRNYRLTVMVKRFACRHDLQVVESAGLIDLYAADDDRALIIDPTGPVFRLADNDGIALACRLDRTRYGFATETDLLNRLADAWLRHNRIPTINPAETIPEEETS